MSSSIFFPFNLCAICVIWIVGKAGAGNRGKQRKGKNPIFILHFPRWQKNAINFFFIVFLRWSVEAINYETRRNMSRRGCQRVLFLWANNIHAMATPKPNQMIAFSSLCSPCFNCRKLFGGVKISFSFSMLLIKKAKKENGNPRETSDWVSALTTRKRRQREARSRTSSHRRDASETKTNFHYLIKQQISIASTFSFPLSRKNFSSSSCKLFPPWKWQMKINGNFFCSLFLK